MLIAVSLVGATATLDTALDITESGFDEIT